MNAVARECANAPTDLHVAQVPRIQRTADTEITLRGLINIQRGILLNLHRSGARLELEGPVLLNDGVAIHVAQHVFIGSDSALSWNVTVTDSDFHSINGAPRHAPVSIGNRVIIGAGATVLKGVTIGDGAIVGAGSVLTRDVAPQTLVAGNPARAIKHGVEWEW